MASCNSTGAALQNADGVQVTEHPYSDEYVGTAEALIAAGIVRADQLPGRPNGPSKTMATFYNGELVPRRRQAPRKDEHWLRVHKVNSKNFSVLRGLTAEVSAARLAAWHEEITAERAAKQQAERLQFIERCQAENTLYYMVNDAEEYRQMLAKKMQGTMREVLRSDVLPGERHGFTLDESSSEEIENLIAQIGEVIDGATVFFDSKRHQEINQKSRAAIAKTDCSFQRVLEGMKHGL